MGEKIFSDWTDEMSRVMGRGVFTAHHTLGDRLDVSDEGLVRLIESHPEEALYVYVMGRDKSNYAEWKLAERPDLSPAELLETTKKGLLWLNVVNVEDHHREWRELLDEIYDELEERTPGFHAVHRTGNVIISSPSSMVHYHADAECNLLWHLRGRKRLWVYPRTERFAPQEQVEMIFAREKEEDLPYSAEFDDFADYFELEPGEVVTWPQNSPHRIENVEGLNVSISSIHTTPEALRKEFVFLANKYFRSVTPFDFRSTDTEGLPASVKAFAFRALRKLRVVRERRFQMPRTVRVDPASPVGYVEIETGEPPAVASA